MKKVAAFFLICLFRPFVSVHSSREEGEAVDADEAEFLEITDTVHAELDAELQSHMREHDEITKVKASRKPSKKTQKTMKKVAKAVVAIKSAMSSNSSQAKNASLLVETEGNAVVKKSGSLQERHKKANKRVEQINKRLGGMKKVKKRETARTPKTVVRTRKVVKKKIVIQVKHSKKNRNKASTSRTYKGLVKGVKHAIKSQAGNGSNASFSLS